MAKASMPRCAWCGKTWQEVMDYTYQPGNAQAPPSSSGAASWNQGGYGNAHGRKATPRRKSRRRSHNGGQQSQGGQQGAPVGAAQYYPPGNWAPNMNTGPYAQFPMAQSPAAPPQQFAPPPPPPLPQGPVPAPDQFWTQQMQQMPVLNSVPTTGPTTPQSPAEVHLQNILGALRQSEETWTPEIQQAV